MNLTHLMQYGIIAVVLIIISLVIVKLNHKNFNLEINKLVQYLGGKDNILDTKVNMSRFKVTLKDISKVDKEGIQIHLWCYKLKFKHPTPDEVLACTYYPKWYNEYK